MKKKTNKELREAKIRAMQHMFYEDVCIYIMEEYSPRVITSQVFMGYNKFKQYQRQNDTKVFEQI